MITVLPFHWNSPASGLRLLLNAGLVGSMRPGLIDSWAPLGVSTTATGVVASPPGRSTNDSPRSVRNRKPTRMLPPGSPPSWLPGAGSIWRKSYVGPPTSWIAAMNVA